MVTSKYPSYNRTELLQVIAANTGSATGGLIIPQHDYVAFTYIGSTNNINTQVFKTGGSGGTTVATLTYGYLAAGAANDDLVTSITQT